MTDPSRPAPSPFGPPGRGGPDGPGRAPGPTPPGGFGGPPPPPGDDGDPRSRDIRDDPRLRSAPGPDPRLRSGPQRREPDDSARRGPRGRPERRPGPAPTAATKRQPEPDRYGDPTMPPPTPVLLARAGVVLFAAAVTGGMLGAALVHQWLITAAVGVLQVLMVIAYVWLRRPPGPLVCLVTGIVASVAADWVALYSNPFSLDKLGYVLAGAFGLTIVGQLLRRGERANLTVSMGSALVVSVIAVGYSGWIGIPRATQTLVAYAIAVIAVGAGVMAARACDITLPKPRINRQVPRGAFGIVIGGMFAAAGSAYASVVLEGPSVTKAAASGLVIGLVGVLGDLLAGYLQAGRRIAGKGVALWPVRHGLGPLLAFGAAGPVAFLVSVYFTLRGW